MEINKIGKQILPSLIYSVCFGMTQMNKISQLRCNVFFKISHFLRQSNLLISLSPPIRFDVKLRLNISHVLLAKSL